MKTMIITIFIGLISMNCYANSPYWTDDVYESLVLLEQEYPNLGFATQLITQKESVLCNKIINMNDLLIINRIYASRARNIMILLEENSANSSVVQNEINQIKCILK
ncbi:TPA: hypothetical protein ACS8CD_003945 [Providencia alcalifaciens]|uniref:Uncharacterized protein n=1 Tax=Providencia alcalifaciens TaxID=126385 RepID=A0AAW9VD94_9GAMM|nr:hypothetical protein [Providencia alcalifaciens]EKT62343.1 hypothetical protein OO9_18726 [Providencia alcalifaciens Dmel2]MTC35852.1 hypothetical protein [Providencia alcalifaciens]